MSKRTLLVVALAAAIVGAQAAAWAVVDWSQYRIDYRRDHKKVDAADIQTSIGLVIKGGGFDTLSVKKAPGIGEVPPIPLVKSDKGLRKARLWAGVENMELGGGLDDLNTFGCHVGSITAASVGFVVMKGRANSADATTPTYALTSIVSGGGASADKPLKPQRIKLTLMGVILENLSAADQDVLMIQTFTKKWHDKGAGQSRLSLGGIGPAGRVAAYLDSGSSGDTPLASGLRPPAVSVIAAKTIGFMSANGGPIVPGAIEADLDQVYGLGQVFTVGGQKRPIASDISPEALHTGNPRLKASTFGGNIRIMDLAAEGGIMFLDASYRKYWDGERKSLGGVVGYEDDALSTPPLFRMRVVASKGDIRDVYGAMGVFGVFVAGVGGGGTPDFSRAIRSIGTQDPASSRLPPHSHTVGIFGEGYLSPPAADKIKFFGDENCVAEGRFKVITHP